MSKKVAITNKMNVGELHDMLMHTGAEVIVETIQSIEQKTTQPTPQKNDSNKIAPKIFTAHCKINWNSDGENIYNLVRGMSPYPGAFTELDEKILKVFDCDFIEDPAFQKQPGEIFTDGRSFLKFACNNGWVELKNVQLAGKKRMLVDELLRGYRIKE